MANTILRFSDDQPVNNSLVVYSDLDLDATPASITFKPQRDRKTEINYLSSDIGSEIVGDKIEGRGTYKDPAEEGVDDFILIDNGIYFKKIGGDESAGKYDYDAYCNGKQDSLLSDSKKDRDDSAEQRIRLYTYEDAQNEKAVAYNREQRKKAHFKLEKNINVNAIKQSIRNIFSWIPGERIINPEFGTKLRSYLYQGITPYNVEAIVAEVQRCLMTWEPRVQLVTVKDVSQVSDTEDNTVQIEIIYTIPSLSPEQYSYTVEVQKSV